jgi:hypothetical protein
MAAQNPKPTARGIEKNSIKRSVRDRRGPARSTAAYPERTQSVQRFSCISYNRCDDSDSQTMTIFLEEIQPGPLPIQGKNVTSILHQFRKMRGLASRRSTGIKNEITWLRVEERRNKLGGFIFDIEITILKSREGCY